MSLKKKAQNEFNILQYYYASEKGTNEIRTVWVSRCAERVQQPHRPELKDVHAPLEHGDQTRRVHLNGQHLVMRIVNEWMSMPTCKSGGKGK